VRWARKATDLAYEVAGLPSLSRRVRAFLIGEAGRFCLDKKGVED
jgi:hypothetical protein